LKWSIHIDLHCKLNYKIRISNLVYTLEKKIDLTDVKAVDWFDFLRQSLSRKEEASSVELLMKLPEILNPLVPLGKLE
jgi:hypothetical protein